MTLFKHTEPPKESGWYLTNLDISVYWNAEKQTWFKKLYHQPIFNVEFHFSKVPPKEIEDVLENIEQWFKLNHPDNHIQSYHLSKDEAKILLKLRAE